MKIINIKIIFRRKPAISIGFKTCLLSIGHGKYLTNGILLIFTIPEPVFKMHKAEVVFLFPEAKT
jgi:hypothetical protein